MKIIAPNILDTFCQLGDLPSGWHRMEYYPEPIHRCHTECNQLRSGTHLVFHC